MNDANQYAALDAARADLASAERQCDADLIALESAKQLETATAVKVENAKQAVAADEAEQVLTLDASIRNGAALVGIQGSFDEDVTRELVKAMHANRIAAGAVQAAVKRHTESHAKVQLKKAALETAADHIFIEEDLETARQLVFHIGEALRIGKGLLFATIADEMTIRGKAPAPKQITAALEKLDFPLLNRRDIAINMWQVGDQPAHALRADRRAALIRGDAIEADDSKAA